MEEGRYGGRKVQRKEGTEGGRNGGTEEGRYGGREVRRKGGTEEGRHGGREKGRHGGREKGRYRKRVCDPATCQVYRVKYSKMFQAEYFFIKSATKSCDAWTLLENIRVSIFIHWLARKTGNTSSLAQRVQYSLESIAPVTTVKSYLTSHTRARFVIL